MDTIKVEVPDILRAYTRKQALTAVVKAFSSYYQQLVPDMPSERKDSLIMAASTTCEMIYDLLQDYVYTGRTKKSISIPFDSGFDLLVENDNTQTTIAIVNRAWDCYLHDYDHHFVTDKVSEKLQWTLLRDGICSLIIGYGLNWRSKCAEDFYKKEPVQ